jgi:diaminopimelate decarboxylase
MSQIITTPAWTIPGFLEARENNHLFIGGADATALTYKYGTPLFVFSEARIRGNIARLQAAAKQVDRPNQVLLRVESKFEYGSAGRRPGCRDRHRS